METSRDIALRRTAFNSLQSPLTGSASQGRIAAIRGLRLSNAANNFGRKVRRTHLVNQNPELPLEIRYLTPPPAGANPLIVVDYLVLVQT